ncbi:hypothetical protein JQC72_02150 [Polycladomyces sp. WAk]|uniref:Uncharacterized protein n=1 Tax=Polycladomyces zharkentensis TaxID=2807616 RepID=A0ABS2WFK5_9BACL|nr:AAA domain-containing protein [Polycladomyces sp. WAk]MBN2908322.1 hypothetical protein [Polycladomyces sp. WAk]
MEKEKRLLRYLFRSFQDRDNDSFHRKQGVHIPEPEFRQGELSAESIKLIKDKMNPDEEAELHICPVFLERTDDPNQILTPLFLPARLEDGKLLPITHRPAYIPRKYLEPTVGHELVLGRLDQLDALAEQTAYAVEGNWSEAIAYAEKLFQHVIGERLQSFVIDGYRRSEQVWVVPIQEGKLNKEFIALYKHLVGSETLPALLQNYLSLEEQKNEPILSCLDQSERHLGQMNHVYPLSPGQRESLHHFFTLNEGEMLAVNGPPGTGKTTLLQNVVASLWVEAAAKGMDDPPVIVATSANNKAITNIIDSFGQTGEKQPDTRTVWGKKAVQLQGRWIPGLKSYGLYLPASSQMGKLAESGHPYHVVSENGEDFMKQMEMPSQVAEAKTYFLSRCAEYAGSTVDSLSFAAELLQTDLVRTCEAIRDGVNLAKQYQAYQERLNREYDGSIEKLSEQIREWEEQEMEASKRKQFYVRLKRDWTEHLNKEPLWWKWLFFLPGINERRRRRNEVFLLEKNHPIEVFSFANDEISRAIDREIQKHEADRQAAEAKRTELQQLLEKIRQSEHRLRTWCRNHEVPFSDSMETLDTSLRYLAFRLATHYWEAKWLMEMEEQIAKGYQESKSSRKTRKKWRRYAKLTPCFVATFHMLPKWFCVYDPVVNQGKKKYQSGYLTGFIDLLIIDEAGQVSPDLAVPAISLAKKALVVGDTMQIEPISSVTRDVDHGNLLGTGVIADLKEAEEIEEKGVTAALGSVMRIAQRRSKYRKNERFGGMFLSEHRRCVPEIIRYCNLLAYGGDLQPLRPSEKKYDFLPHLGYADIRGEAKDAGGRGKFNVEEAEAIVGWIRNHREKLEHISGKAIGDILGIVTPFRYQTVLIRELLKELGISDITVGTVHALQGAEKDIVLFSPVVGSKSGKPFYDRNLNMMNVAVSRAKDSFLVFGNMEEFGLIPGTPSHLLKSLLYKPENKIPVSYQNDRLLPHLTRRMRTRRDSFSMQDRTIVQQIIHIHKNEGQVLIAQDQGKIVATQNIRK